MKPDSIPSRTKRRIHWLQLSQWRSEIYLFTKHKKCFASREEKVSLANDTLWFPKHTALHKYQYTLAKSVCVCICKRASTQQWTYFALSSFIFTVFASKKRQVFCGNLPILEKIAADFFWSSGISVTFPNLHFYDYTMLQQFSKKNSYILGGIYQKLWGFGTSSGLVFQKNFAWGKILSCLLREVETQVFYILSQPLITL